MPTSAASTGTGSPGPSGNGSLPHPGNGSQRKEVPLFFDGDQSPVLVAKL
ncbi:hypothetical protein [Cyclobacterium salsum]|nr:hypothetical protein [Cyclobacterium salsum]